MAKFTGKWVTNKITNNVELRVLGNIVGWWRYADASKTHYWAYIAKSRKGFKAIGRYLTITEAKKAIEAALGGK